MSRTPYMKEYMRKERAWDKGVEAVMRLPPAQRYDAAVQLHLRVHHDEIMRAHKYQTLFVELLTRLRSASDAVPFFDEGRE
jgi:hypothetical protein